MLFILNKSHKVVGSLNSNGDLSKITTYFDDSYVQDLTTGAETFQFSTLADNIESQHLVVGNFIAFKEEDEFKLFNIVQIEETHEDTFIKTVYCEMASIELINEIVRPMKVLNSSLRKFLNSILEETEWQLGKMDAGFTQVYDFEISDYTSVYSLIQKYAVGVYGAEISYRVEIEHGEIVGKYIDCYAERGNSNGFRFAYGSNLTSVVRTVDTSELATALIGIGNNGLTFKSLDLADKPMGQDFIASESAYKQWNVNGSHIMGIHRADTDSEHELLRLTRIALEERSEPKVKYEMKVEILGKKVKIGDTVNVVDHEFNPPLYLSARVNQLTKSKTNPYNDEVVLANFKELNSNITEEMRQLATQLEGYVDSQFPIGGDKIQDGAIGEQQISKQYHTQVVADAVYASMIEVGELVATKVDVEELNAIYASIEDLNAKKASIEDLTAQKAEIEELVAKKADIESLKAITANIETLYTEKANVTDLNALNATVTNLKAEKADINDLNATNATIESLKVNKADIDSLNALEIKVNTINAEKANISDLNATNATIANLQANKADITELNAVKGDITHLYSEVAEIGTLKSDVADINELLAGNITADNIATGAITAGSGIIADGAIGSAQISDLDASKISAGVVDTSKVTIQGVDGHLKLKGNRLQVFTGTGELAKERVSLGDVNGDGTIYGLRVRGADGTTILLDENGVTSEGITDGSINNSKISDDANIDGSKLNINSVVSKINEDGTETIQGTKIEVDGTTLNTKLSTITTKQTEDSERITQAQSQITANTNAIKLKVDEQTYATDKKGTETTLNKHTSEINALKDEVAIKVGKTEVAQIVDEVTGELIDSKIDTAKAEIKVTTDTISQNVSNLTQTVSNKADSSTVSTINNKVGSLETSVNGISGKVTSLEKTTTDLGESVEGVQGEVSTLKSDVASLEVTTSGISQKVSSVESTTASLTTQVGTANENATNALNKANSANTLADSKAKVFTTTPTVPYKIGDLWVQGTSGDVMRCKTARSTGSYTASDWEKASKYTDDTKANAVDGKLTTLQGEYNTTKSQVATLETNLDGITQRVSSTESTTATLTNKVNTAQSTADSAKSTATNAQNTANTANSNATSAKNTANTANTNASSALSKAENATAEITKTNQKVSSIETNLGSITSRVSNVESKTTTIDGKVTALDTRMTSAEQKITDKAIISTVTETIDQKVNTGINNIKIGNRNLLFMDNVVNRDSSNFTKDGYTVSFTHNSEWQGIQFYNLRETLKLGVEYSLQYKIKKTSGTLTGIAQHCDSQFEIIDFRVDGVLRNATSTVSDMGINDENWHTCILRFKRKTDSTESDANRIISQPNRGLTTVVSVEMKDFKIEEGNKVTDWNPSPEDVEKSISDTEKVLNGNIDTAVGSAKEDVLKNVSENYTGKDEFKTLNETVTSKFEQTSKDITATFETAQNYTKEVDGKLQEFQNTVGTHIRFSADGIDLGKTNSPFTATLDNTKLAFKQDGTEVAYISNNKMYITQAEIKDSLRIGTNTTGFFTWVQSSSGNLSLKWSDK